MYTNYSHFIDRAEIRVFEAGQSLEAEPLDTFPIETDGTNVAVWKAPRSLVPRAGLRGAVVRAARVRRGRQLRRDRAAAAVVRL